MRWLAILRRYSRDAIRGRRMGREIDEEVQFHFESLVEELIARGASPLEAQTIAARRFGRPDLVRDAARYAKGVGLIDDLRQDVRYGVRRFRREPVFTAVAVLTIALAIGLNTAIFAVVHGVLLRALPYDQPDRLVAIWRTAPDEPPFKASTADFLDWRERNTVFEDVAATEEGFVREEFDVVTDSGATRLAGARVSTNLFSVLGVRAALGRTFARDEDLPGRNRLVILGHEAWKSVFGADTRIVGKRIRLDGEPFDVIGVLPSGIDLTYPKATAIFVPIDRPQRPASRNNGAMVFNIYARLKPGVTVGRADAAMKSLMQTLTREYPLLSKDISAAVVPLHEDRFGSSREASRMLATAVGLVLLIAAANIANLLLARGSARSHEIAIRAALGSGRLRLVRQLLAENLLLAALGGVTGLVLGTGLTWVLVALAPPTLPRLDQVIVDLPVVTFTFSCAAFCAALFGVVPAFRTTRAGAISALRLGEPSVAGVPGRIGFVLVAAEIGLVVVSLSVAALMVNSLWRLMHVPLGFNPHGVLAAEVYIPERIYRNQNQTNDFFEQRKRSVPLIRGFTGRLLEAVERLPGVQLAGTTSCLPLDGDYARRGFMLPGNQHLNFVSERRIDPGYLRALKVNLIEGRLFTADDRTGPPAVLINRELARIYFPNERAAGKRLQTSGIDDVLWYDIVGVVDDMREQTIATTPQPVLYFDREQDRVDQAVILHLVVRTTADPSSLAAALRDAVKRTDPELPLRNVMTLDELVARNLAPARFYATVLAVFSLVALAVAAIGIYGVLSHAVGQRTREIGVRIALGASATRIAWLVLSDVFVVVAVGLAAGLAGTWGVGKVIRNFLFNVSPWDPVALGGGIIILVVVAACAATLPARRATRVDPMNALRCE